MPISLETKRVRVPEGVPRLLRDLIHDRTGIFFEDSRTDFLLEKLEPLAARQGFQSFLDYYYVLKDGSVSHWNEAWEALSVQETYFWREMSQIDALTQIIVPRWFEKNSAPFRIWSAACATGEEPFTIVMALEESGLGARPIEIVASDASGAALEKAAAAVYREKSFRKIPLHLWQKYFEATGGGWRLSRKVVDRVTFKRANLLDPADIAAYSRVNVIFCRNVFIYFSPHAIRQTVAIMARKMASGGCLFVGAAESLMRATSDFELTEMGDALAYVRI